MPHGAVFVDGMGSDRYHNVVLRTQDSLRDTQVIIASVVVNLEKGELIAGPELSGRGFDDPDGQKLLEEAEVELKRFLERSLRRGNMSYGYMVSRVKDNLARFVHRKAKLRPMIMPVVTEF